MKLQNKDIALAKSRTFLNPRLHMSKNPKRLLAWYMTMFDKLGYKLLQKEGPKSWKMKRITTTFRRRVYVGVTWPDLSTRAKAALLAHEYVHALQWRKLPRFGRRYVFNERFRWAVEVQAHREQIRALRSMGVDEDVLAVFADDIEEDFKSNYAAILLSKKAIECMSEIMMEQ